MLRFIPLEKSGALGAGLAPPDPGHCGILGNLHHLSGLPVLVMKDPDGNN